MTGLYALLFAPQGQTGGGLALFLVQIGAFIAITSRRTRSRFAAAKPSWW